MVRRPTRKIKKKKSLGLSETKALSLKEVYDQSVSLLRNARSISAKEAMNELRWTVDMTTYGIVLPRNAEEMKWFWVENFPLKLVRRGPLFDTKRALKYAKDIKEKVEEIPPIFLEAKWMGDDLDGEWDFEVIDGNHRVHAARRAGMNNFKAIVGFPSWADQEDMGLKEAYLKEKKAISKWLWHISNERFNRFNPRMTAQGIIWFAKDKEDLIKEKHGASIRSNKPIWLYKCTADVSNPAGWKEYDKYGLGELESLGYDSIDLDEDFVVLDAKNIKIHEVEQIKDLAGLDEEYLGTKGGVQYFQMGGSLPKSLYNRKKGRGSRDVGVAGLSKGKSSSEKLEKDEKKKRQWYQTSIREVYDELLIPRDKLRRV